MLWETLRSWVGAGQRLMASLRSPPAALTDPEVQVRLRVVLAVKDDDLGTEVARFLTDDGHEVTHAPSEMEALRLAAAWPADLLMSDDASRETMQSWQAVNLPIGVAVCHLTDADAAEGEIGSDSKVLALGRPVEREALRAVLLGVVKGRGADRRGAPAAAARPALLDRPTLDELAESLGPDDFGQVIEVFLADMPPLIARLEHAVSRGDFAATFAAAHEGTGIAATLGMPRLAEAMRRIEAASRSENAEVLPELLEDARLTWTETAYAVDLLPRG